MSPAPHPSQSPGPALGWNPQPRLRVSGGREHPPCALRRRRLLLTHCPSVPFQEKRAGSPAHDSLSLCCEDARLSWEASFVHFPVTAEQIRSAKYRAGPSKRVLSPSPRAHTRRVLNTPRTRGLWDQPKGPRHTGCDLRRECSPLPTRPSPPPPPPLLPSYISFVQRSPAS